MASKYWIKLYHEILHDPKMGRLSDRLYRRCVEMFLLAGEMDEEGRLPAVEDMAWTLRTDPDELAGELEELASAGIVYCEDGEWTVTHFATRQAPNSDAERMARYRERQRKAQYHGDESVTALSQERSDAVTNRNVEAEEKRREADVDADTEPRVDAPSSGNGQSAAATGPGGLGKILAEHGVIVSSAVQSEMWQDLYRHAGQALFQAALREAVASQKGPLSMRYVEAIIKRCQEEGTVPGQRASPSPPTTWENPFTHEEESIDDG